MPGAGTRGNHLATLWVERASNFSKKNYLQARKAIVAFHLLASETTGLRHGWNLTDCRCSTDGGQHAGSGRREYRVTSQFAGLDNGPAAGGSHDGGIGRLACRYRPGSAATASRAGPAEAPPAHAGAPRAPRLIRTRSTHTKKCGPGSTRAAELFYCCRLRD
jgi:hypothetical protein